MPDVGGSIIQLAADDANIHVVAVGTTAKRNEKGSDGTLRVGDICFDAQTGRYYTLLTTAPTWRDDGISLFGGGGLTLPLSGTLNFNPATSPFVDLGDDATGMLLGTAEDNRIDFQIEGVFAGRLDYAPTPTVTGRGNTMWGYNAAPGSTTDATNGTYLGGEAGFRLTSGSQNTIVGNRAGYELTTGDQNTLVGQGAGYWFTGNLQTAFGYHAGLNAVGANNLFFGTRAGEGGIDGSIGGSTGTNNVFVGNSIGTAFTTASSNTHIGYQAGQAITTGVQNVAIGYQALASVNSGGGNTVIGREAGESITTVSNNTMVGKLAGQATTTANNTMVGTAAGIVTTSGTDNTFVGYQTGYTATPANATTTGSENVFVGHNAGAGTATQISNSIAIGYGVTVDTSDTYQVGTSSGTTIHPGGQRVKRTVSAAGNITATASDFVIGKTGISGGGDTVTLPAAVAGQQIVVKDESGSAATDNITIATPGSENIDGAATATISANYGVLRLYSDGTDWFSF